MKIRLLTTCGLAAGLALTAAACSSSPSSSSAASPATSAPASSAASSLALGDDHRERLRPGLRLGAQGRRGQLHRHVDRAVATAASANPLLSTLVTAVKKAGLVDTLNSASGITVFAPDNAAFAKIPAATLNSVLSNKAELTKILTYHVVAGRYTPTQLAAGTPLKTLEGGTVTPALMGSTYEVNSADVVCGNVQTANATVYIINTVLMPPSS